MPGSARCEEGVRHLTELASRALQGRRGLYQGLVLTGSAARGEATILPRDGRSHWLSDLECLAPIASRRQLPEARRELAELSRVLSGEMADRGHDVEVELTPAPLSYFKGLKPHLFSVELKRHGRRLFGGSDCLSMIPPLESGAIQPEEGWRLLSNRLVEDLDSRVGGGRRVIDRLYGDVKLAVDVLTSFSVVFGLHEPSYGERYAARDRILAKASEAGLDPELAACYRILLDQAMAFKTEGLDCAEWRSFPQQGLWQQADAAWHETAGTSFEAWGRLTEIATASWALQLNMIVGKGGPNEAPEDVLRSLQDVYGLGQRLRGWVSAVAKARPELRRRVIRQAMRVGRSGSPRALTYGCAWLLLLRRQAPDQPLPWVAAHLPLASDADSWIAQGRACTGFWRDILRMSAA